MSYSSLQSLLAKLLTQPSLREEWLQNPVIFAQKHQISSEELSWLQQIVWSQVEEFSSSLVHKRYQQIRKLLPFSSQICQESFSLLFQEFASVFTPSGIRKHQLDAVEFAKFLMQKVKEQKLSLPPWSLDVFRYESQKISFFLRKKKIQMLVFSYPVHRIIQQLKQKEELQEEAQLSWVLWIVGKQKGFREKIIFNPWAKKKLGQNRAFQKGETMKKTE